MNICFFTRSLPVHRIGGMEIHANMLIHGFSAGGNKVCVITTRHPEGIKEENKGNLKIFYLSRTVPGKYSRNWWKESLYCFEKLNKVEKFDIIFSESAGALSCLKRKFKIPVVVNLHGTALEEAKTKLRIFPSLRSLGAIKNILNYFRDIHLYPNADAVICCSRDLYLKVLKEGFTPENKIYIVNNGVDTEVFSHRENTELKRKLTGEFKNKIIMFSGRIKKEKGIEILLKAFKKVYSSVQNVKLLIIGDGDFLSHSVSLTRKLDISHNVLFLGKVTYNKLPDYYSLADIFVYPTLRGEGLPYAILEAMSCETPVVASSIGGIPDIIEHKKDGLLFNPGDELRLADLLLSLLKNEEMMRKMGISAREKIISEFSKEKMVRETLQIMKRVKKC